jgi:HlyD family secretion protein
MLISGLWFFVFRNNKESSLIYRTAPIQYGNLISSISATGTVEPEELIDVGAQVARKIVSFGKDKNN